MSEKLYFNTYKIFEEQEDKYIYLIDSNEIFQIDDRTYQLIKQEGKTIAQAKENVKSLFSSEEFEEVISDMREAKFICSSQAGEREENQELLQNENILSITILLVQECNLRCTYCYGEGGEYFDRGKISLETARKAVDFLIEQSGTEKDLSVALFGGEPLIAFPLIKELVPYIRKREKEADKNIYISMTSNGTLINDEIEKYLIENQIGVQISIDGDEETQNENRFYANKRGSYQDVIKNTSSMRKKGLLSARATMTSKNINMSEIFYHLDSLGFGSIAFAPAYNLLSEEDYEKLADEEVKFIGEFERLIKEKQYDKALKMKILLSNLVRIHKGLSRSMACGVGRKSFAIDIHGDVYPCQRFVNSKEYKLGSVLDGKVDNMKFKSEIVLSSHEQCKNCWARNLCVGGCPHENYMVTGKVMESPKRICNLYLKRFEHLIKVYIRLTEKEKQKLGLIRE
ncbi:PapB family radical SAM/SPASM ranthipeptide maturase [[Clostridium] polysaccharolyticum]|uniref:Radical SAM core domain-containing protein n=1 Tax=[Clostridium] polysaccharolyticum TaxID=29364 RepID=A0A1I0DKI3_9FIRM|nr:radical SAM protein [[Clostridium] polysaccharolyticum]SET32340.1 uncharacterized protein SAMN04487772_11512 [[Clostridium] polysaccharolyticum]